MDQPAPLARAGCRDRDLGAVILVLPESLGTALLGPVWQPARHLASPVMAGWLGTGIIAGAAAGLRSLAAAQEGLRARLIGSVLALAGGVSGAVAGGALGATTVWLSPRGSKPACGGGSTPGPCGVTA